MTARSPKEKCAKIQKQREISLHTVISYDVFALHSGQESLCNVFHQKQERVKVSHKGRGIFVFLSEFETGLFRVLLRLSFHWLSKREHLRPLLLTSLMVIEAAMLQTK